MAFFVAPRVATASGPFVTPASVFDCNPGPWGDLEYVRFTLEPPDHYAEETVGYIKGTRWFFKGFNRSKLTNYLNSVGFSDADLKALEKTPWISGETGTWVTPSEELVIDLKPEVRARLYSTLSTFEENGYFHTPFLFRKETLDERFRRPGLTDKTVALVKSLLYSRGSLVAFSDIAAVMSKISDHRERVELVKLLSRKSTLMLRLKLTDKTDVTQLLQYWGAAGRAKDLKPLLQSLVRVDGGWEVDVAHLLPPFARERIYTYPTPSNTVGPKENCHWTSFNFFAETPDDGFRQPPRLKQALDNEYDVVSGQKQLGDVLLVMDSNDAVLHSAVYIADDIVFTKTGGRENQPWILMKVEDMLPLYASANQPLKSVYCRKKVIH